MGFWERIWRRKKFDEDEGLIFEQVDSSRGMLNQRLKGILGRSKQWDDKDLREIVEVIHMLNDQMLKLSQNVDNLSSNISRSSFGLPPKREDYERPLKPAYSETSSFRSLPSPKVPARSRPPRELPSKPLEPRKEQSMPSPPEKIELEQRLKILGQYVKIFGEILEMFQIKEGELCLDHQKFKDSYDNVSSKLQEMNTNTSVSPKSYASLSRELIALKFDPPALGLFARVESALEDPQSLEPDNVSRFEKLHDEMTKLIALTVINPKIGTKYSKAECDVVSVEGGDGNQSGVIQKVLRRGYKRGDDLIHKAKVTIVG